MSECVLLLSHHTIFTRRHNLFSLVEVQVSAEVLIAGREVSNAGCPLQRPYETIWHRSKQSIQSIAPACGVVPVAVVVPVFTAL